MLTEQFERRVRGESLVELINKPLDMSQQVEDDDGDGDLDDGFQPGLQVSQGGQKPAVMQPDSSNVPMVFRPKLENIHQSPPRSQPETSMSPPRSDVEQRCSFHSVPFSHHYLKHHHHHNHINTMISTKTAKTQVRGS